jgi:hypothetical protein
LLTLILTYPAKFTGSRKIKLRWSGVRWGRGYIEACAMCARVYI